MNILKKVSTSAAFASISLSILASSALASSAEIVDNGADSTNIIKLSSECVSTVYQYNKTKANTTVYSSANSGVNTASGNTGGDVTIDTGQATSSVGVAVTGGDNTATAPNCCECADSLTAKVEGNGVDSFNKVKSWESNVTISEQKTKTFAWTSVLSKAKSGKNKAKWNTGGLVEVKTDDATSSVGVSVSGGGNTLNP